MGGGTELFPEFVTQHLTFPKRLLLTVSSGAEITSKMPDTCLSDLSRLSSCIIAMTHLLEISSCLISDNLPFSMVI